MTVYASDLASTSARTAHLVRSDLINTVRSATRTEGYYLVVDVVSNKRTRTM